MSECALYDIIIWERVFVWTRFIWYYSDGRLYLSEFALKVIIKMRACMCLKALYIILLKWELVFVWTRFIWYYCDGRLYLSECALKLLLKWELVCECALYDIIKMVAGICLNAQYMMLLRWEIVFVRMHFKSCY